jgi:hypothetical protein
MMDDDVNKKLRIKQAKGMVELERNYSFSQCVNDTLRAGLKGK